VAPVLGDSKPRVKAIALEALAVVNNAIGTDMMMMLLSRHAINEEDVRALYTRLKLAQLPAVSVDGVVEHLATVTATAPPSSSGSSQGFLYVCAGCGADAGGCDFGVVLVLVAWW
jgi:ribosomal protein L12E/L44/L45/RPP1/RPP2